MQTWPWTDWRRGVHLTEPQRVRNGNRTGRGRWGSHSRTRRSWLRLLPYPPLSPTTNVIPAQSPAHVNCLASHPNVYTPPSTAAQSAVGTSSLPPRTVCPPGRYSGRPPPMAPRHTATVGPAGPNAARSRPCSARIWSCASALVGNMSRAQASGSSDKACGDGRGPRGGPGGVKDNSSLAPLGKQMIQAKCRKAKRANPQRLTRDSLGTVRVHLHEPTGCLPGGQGKTTKAV